ncbi:Fe-S cluster assembly protein SufD [Stappia sp. GBMRC 2046]|uniref:Fe-S cluster assembly protein SufD n=1 Tax=Stappia sediminis TaxID=2692190 RepID=A0A7X3LSZ9_9HYPH|nr:Fe-S cluster assembly protein SufD [Stappia sediminis]MXN64541.1 Fe-S cluster assembly protein SufD [Stappia sediminis]
MNMETRSLKTSAETELASLFDGARGDFAGSDAVRKRREEAFSAFDKRGLPHRRVEEYKYSDIRAKLKSASALVAAGTDGDAKAALDAVATYGDLERYRIVIDNGRLVTGLSDIGALKGEGVTVSDLNAALGETDGLLDVSTIAAADPMIMLNTALVLGGAVVRVGDGVEVSRPIEIVYTASATGARYTRCRIELGKGAKATILESFEDDVAEAEGNAVSDFVIGDEAKLTLARVVTGEATHVSSVLMDIGASAEVKAIGFNMGTDFARTQSFVTFSGEHSNASLYGITMVREKQHSDHTLVVDHKVPNCESRERFKAVIDDFAEGVFQGKIIVRPHAQKTDGRMMTQALLLSEDASMANKPELEIFADDVQCAHGATSGQIDEDLLFYLRARGIPEAQARMLLVLAFLAEAVEEMEDEGIVSALEGRIRDWLSVEE